VDAELIAHAAREGKVKTAGPPVRLGVKAAETLGLALHELRTNAVKFGALCTGRRPDHGHLRQGDRPRRPLCGVWSWIEESVAACPQQPARRGFGLDLIERTVPLRAARGEPAQFRAGGIHCVIDIPLTRDNIVSDRTR